MTNAFLYSGTELKEELRVDWECFADKVETPIPWGTNSDIDERKIYITNAMLSDWSEIKMKILIVVKNALQLQHLINRYMGDGFQYTQHKNQITDGESVIQFTTKRYQNRYLDDEYDEIKYEGV